MSNKTRKSVLLICDEPTPNGTIYPRIEVEKMVNRYHKAFDTLNENEKYENIEHIWGVAVKVIDLFFEGNMLMIEYQILNAPAKSS